MSCHGGALVFIDSQRNLLVSFVVKLLILAIVIFLYILQYTLMSQKHEVYVEEKQKMKKTKKPRNKKSSTVTVSAGLDVEEDSNMEGWNWYFFHSIKKCEGFCTRGDNCNQNCIKNLVNTSRSFPKYEYWYFFHEGLFPLEQLKWFSGSQLLRIQKKDT